MLERLFCLHSLAKGTLKEESAQRLWNLMINAAVRSSDKPERVGVAACYTLVNQRLTSYIERIERRVRFARRLAILDAWVWLTGSTKTAEIVGDKKRYILVNSYWFLLTGFYQVYQTRHNHFEFWQAWSPLLLGWFLGLILYFF